MKSARHALLGMGSGNAAPHVPRRHRIKRVVPTQITRSEAAKECLFHQQATNYWSRLPHTTVCFCCLLISQATMSGETPRQVLCALTPFSIAFKNVALCNMTGARRSIYPHTPIILSELDTSFHVERSY